MAEFSVPVVKIGKVGKHPNADSLSITQVEGCPCIFRTGDFNTGDQAIYIPIDAVVPLNAPHFAFLKKANSSRETARIRAARLRGIFSMGVLIRHDVTEETKVLSLGQDATIALGITKYEEPIDFSTSGDAEHCPVQAPVYGVEHYRKYKHVLKPGECVVVSEKLHGTNARFVFAEDRLYSGSHRQFKRDSSGSVWWSAAREYDLASKLQELPGVVLYGEIYGDGVQDLKYGLKGEIDLALFDAYDSQNGVWFDWNEVVKLANRLGVPVVPVLDIGPYSESVEEHANGTSTIASHMREGVVIKPIVNRHDLEIGRVVLKLIGEEYLLRKGGTEHH